MPSVIVGWTRAKSFWFFTCTFIMSRLGLLNLSFWYCSALNACTTLMPVRFSRATRLIWSVSFCTMRKRGMQMLITVITVTQMTTTNVAVTAESSQLLPRILMMAHTAMIGDLIIICRPIATII